MKMDWELVRKVLVMAEELPPEGMIQWQDLGVEDEGLARHTLWLVIDAGLAHGPSIETNSGARSGMVTSLTWKGHELLDSIRSDKIWEQVKKSALSKGIDLTLDIITSLAAKFIKEVFTT